MQVVSHAGDADVVDDICTSLAQHQVIRDEYCFALRTLDIITEQCEIGSASHTCNVLVIYSLGILWQRPLAATVLVQDGPGT